MVITDLLPGAPLMFLLSLGFHFGFPFSSFSFFLAAHPASLRTIGKLRLQILIEKNYLGLRSVIHYASK